MRTDPCQQPHRTHTSVPKVKQTRKMAQGKQRLHQIVATYMQEDRSFVRASSSVQKVLLAAEVQKQLCLFALQKV